MRYYVNMNEGFPVACGRENCDRVLRVPVDRFAAVFLCASRIEVLAIVNSYSECSTGPCSAAYAYGSTGNPDAIDHIVRTVDPTIVHACD
jgi:hypothetical protein